MEGFTPPQEGKLEEEKVEKKFGGKLGRWARKSAAFVGAVGLGYLGGTEQGQAKGAEDLLQFSGGKGAKKEFSVKKQGERVVLDEPLYSIKATGHKESIKTGYGMELQELYTVTDKETGESRQFFSVDEKSAMENGKEFLFPIHPEWFPDLKGAVETERAFQQSGLTEPGGYSGPIEVGKQKSSKESRVDGNFQKSGLTEPTENTKGINSESLGSEK